DSGRLPRLPDAFDTRFDLFDGSGMQRMAQIPHRCRKIGRPDENSIDTLDVRDLLDALESLKGFNLNQHAELLVRMLQVIRLGAKGRSAYRGARHPPDAGRRKPRRAHDLASLL